MNSIKRVISLTGLLVLLQCNIACGEVRRVVSLVPSVTEIIFALGAGDKLVGVTPYCDFPREAKELPKVGGLLNPNYEVLIELKPELVILLNDRDEIGPRLRRLGIRSISVKNESLSEILGSILIIGEELGVEDNAEDLVGSLKRQVEVVNKEFNSLLPPKVLVVVGGHLGRDKFEKVHGAGKNTIFDELLEKANAKNVLERFSGYPNLSSESVLALNPDVILDLLPQTSSKSIDRERALAFWRALPHLKAVKNDEVRILTDEYIINPGPRVVKTLELFAKAIHHKRVN